MSYQVQPWGEVHGVGVFSDPYTHHEFLIIAADGACYATRADNAATELALPSGVTLTGTVSFTQAFDTFIMHRGAGLDTLVMTRVSRGFELVEQTASGNGTHPIPNADYSLFLGNRLFIPNDVDEVAASDLGDYTRYVPVLQELRINQGSADAIVGLNKFNEQTVVVFKNHSIYAISNVYGDLTGIVQDELTSQFGLVARRSVAQVGKDLWFLSELGVMSLTQTEQGKLQGVLLPVSDPIQPLIERINWQYAANAVSAYWDNKYYLAVPLDDAEVLGEELISRGFPAITIDVTAGVRYRFTPGASYERLTNGAETLTHNGDFTAAGATVTLSVSGFLPPTVQTEASLRRLRTGVNNAVLVYDFLNQAWSGHDESEGFSFKEMFQFTVGGKRRLFTATDAGSILLYEDGYDDQLPVPYTELVVTSLPASGDTLTVNDGTVVTANGSGSNSATTWGCSNLATAKDNLWAVAGDGGYRPENTLAWTAPEARAEEVEVGTLRFYATNGVVPSVVTTGDWATVTEHGVQDIPVTFVSRGYATEDGSLERYQWAAADLQTWAPTTTFEVLANGVEETQVILDAQTKSRTAYYEPSDAAAYDETNANGDFLTPYREDYSVKLGTGGAEEFDLSASDGGVPFDLHQECRETARVNLRGRSARLQITNTTGRVRVMAVGLQADAETIRAGNAA